MLIPHILTKTAVKKNKEQKRKLSRGRADISPVDTQAEPDVLTPTKFYFPTARLSLLTSVPFPSSRPLPSRPRPPTPWAESWRWLFKSTPYARIQFPFGRPLWPPSSLPLPLDQLRRSQREGPGQRHCWSLLCTEALSYVSNPQDLMLASVSNSESVATKHESSLTVQSSGKLTQTRLH